MGKPDKYEKLRDAGCTSHDFYEVSRTDALVIRQCKWCGYRISTHLK